jgi:hypothetical protein
VGRTSEHGGEAVDSAVVAVNDAGVRDRRVAQAVAVQKPWREASVDSLRSIQPPTLP